MNLDGRHNRAGHQSGHDISFRRNDHDRRPPSRVLTGALLGDPMPDRMERDRATRLRLGIVADDAPTVSPAILSVLRVLMTGPMGGGEIYQSLGLSRSVSDGRTKSAYAQGLIEKQGRGNRRHFRITEEGRAALEAQAQ